jgi:ABC-type antimicrobial peptide transport system permease subunit
VALVSAELARRLWPGASALDRRLRVTRARTDEWFTVVGVVGDTHLQAEADPEASIDLYLPHRQVSDSNMTLLVRTAGDPGELATVVKEQIFAVDPGLPPFENATADALFERATGAARLVGRLFGLFALAAVVLTLVGIYGSVGYSVARRAPEIGIRLALGAQPISILRMLIFQLLKLVAIGTVLGLLGAVAVSSGLASILEGMEVLDPVIFLGAAAALVAIAVVTGYLAARPGLRVDPATTLRTE